MDLGMSQLSAALCVLENRKIQVLENTVVSEW